MTQNSFKALARDVTPPSKKTGAPIWVHLLTSGVKYARDGRHFILSNPEHVISTFSSGGVDLPIDYEHQNDKQVEGQTGPVPAAGWINELRHDESGLWGRVEWTAKAAQMIAAKEYRYISPVLRHGKDAEILSIKGAGLVHNPALTLTALASEEDMSTTDNQPEPPIDAFAKFLAAMGVKPNASGEDMVLALRKLFASKDEVDPTKYAPIETLAEMMSSRNDAVILAHGERIKAKIKDADEKGYLGGQNMIKWATDLCSADEASFDAFIEGCPPMFAHLLERREKPDIALFEQTNRTETELSVLRQLGLPEDTIL